MTRGTSSHVDRDRCTATALNALAAALRADDPPRFASRRGPDDGSSFAREDFLYA